MKYKRIAGMTVLCLIVAICSSPVFAKVYARVSGSVKSEDGKPIAGARVILIFAADGAKIETTTDNKGRWSKVNLRAGAWTMGFMADGYEPENINVTLNAIKTNPPIDIKLVPVPESPLKKPDELYQQGKYAEALQEYQRVLAENQELYEVWEKIGLCYYKLDDRENAVKAFKMMLEKNPGSREVLINLTAIYLGKGNLEEGMKYFNRLDEEALKDHSIFYNIGILLFNNNQMDMAIDYFKKSVTRNPNYAEAYFQLALAYLNKGGMAEAKKNLQKVIEIAPESDKAAQAKDIIKSLN
jgi:tetratricopeptide (TPR) repeat protein